MHRHHRASNSHSATPDDPEAPAAPDDTAAAEELIDILLADDAARAIRKELEQLREAVVQLRRVSDAHQQRYRTLLDAVPDAVTLFDEDDRIIDANRVACERFGKSLAQLAQLKVQDINPELPAHHMRQIWQRHTPGNSFSEMAHNQHADGSWHPSEIHSNLFLDNGKRRIIAVARDITEQQQMLDELRASESRNRMLLNAMDKGVLIQDADGQLTSANPAACRLLGLSLEEMKSLDRDTFAAWRFVDRNNKPLHPRQLPGFQALQTGEIVQSTLVGVYIPHLHAYRWFSINAVPQFDEANQKIVQVVSTFSDVSALKRENEMFQSTQQLGDIGSWEMDDLRGSLFWTSHMYRIHDLEPGSNISEARMLNFFTPESRADASHALAKARTRGDHFDLELEMHTAIGRHRWVNFSGQPLQREGRIYGIVGTTQNIEERKNLERRLRQQATRDALTGLPNRNVLLEMVESQIAAAKPGDRLVVFYIDLDRFKVLSDMLGHLAGDRLLQAAARRLHECTHDAGQLARFGNDEFVLLVANRDFTAQPQQLAQQILDAFGRVFNQDGEKLALGVSIGIAAWPRDGETAEELIQHADEAMFEAKRRGRSTWQEYNLATRERKRERLEIESQLRLAVDNGEMYLVYQPQLCLADRTLAGVEALLRWDHPQLGAIPPDRFIPFAEASGDIVRIGAWVINEACRQLASWRDAGMDIGHMAINVSHRQVLSGNLVSCIRDATERHAVPPSLLELEFTERVLIDSFPETVGIFRELRALGVGLLIDDFGEGFSALSYLRHLPIDGIKISHTFMQGIPDQASDAVICEAMVRIADTLRLRVIAEGVETAAQRDFMQRQGVRYAQGFLFSRPLKPQQLAGYAEGLACIAQQPPAAPAQ